MYLRNRTCTTKPIQYTSDDITPTGKVLYQHQLNMYTLLSWKSKSHFVYVTNKRLDAGVNLINVPLNFSKDKQLISYNDQSCRLPL